MPGKNKYWMTGLLLLSAVMPVKAQSLPEKPNVVQSSARPVTTEERANIIQLLEVSGAIAMSRMIIPVMTEQMMGMFRSSMPQLPEHGLVILGEEVNSVLTEGLDAPGGLIDQYVDVYHRYFTNEEIKALVVFHQSPVGKKSIDVMPKIFNESQSIGLQWGAQLAPVILKRLQARLDKMPDKPAGVQSK